MLKLKLRHFGHLMWRTNLLEKILMLEKTEAGGEGDDRGWDGWMTSPTRWTWVWVNSGSLWWTGRPGVLQWGCKELDTTQQLNWTEPNLWYLLSQGLLGEGFSNTLSESLLTTSTSYNSLNLLENCLSGTLSPGLPLGNPQGDEVTITRVEEACQDWVPRGYKEL